MEPTPEQLAYERGFAAGFAAGRKARVKKRKAASNPVTLDDFQKVMEEVKRRQIEIQDERHRQMLRNPMRTDSPLRPNFGEPVIYCGDPHIGKITGMTTGGTGTTITHMNIVRDDEPPACAVPA